MSETPRFSLIPAVYVILRRREGDARQVLLQMRAGTGFMDGHWASGAAGHVESGESLFEAAVREGTEELGITIHPMDLLPLTVMHRRHEDAQPINQRMDTFFVCDRWEGDPSLQEPHKAADLRWFDLDDLPSPLVPHEARVLSGLASGELPHLTSFGFDE